MSIIKFETRVRKSGNSFYVNIPKKIKEGYNLKENEELGILKVTKLSN